MIKAIFFDNDGVLSIGMMFTQRYEQEHGVLTQVTLPFFKGEFRDCIMGKADLKEKLLPLLSSWQWNGTVDELLQYWFDGENVPNTKLLSYISEVRKKGIACYVTTCQEKYRTEYIKKEMNFENIFDKVFSSSDIGLAKPDPKFFDYILDNLQLKPEEVIYFDDEEKNIESARTLGIYAYLYTGFEDCKEKIDASINAE